MILAGLFALGIALLSMSGNYTLDLAHFLFGNLLGVSSTDLWVIAGLGGNICSVARFGSEDPERVYITFRLEGVEEEALLSALKNGGDEVVHVCCAA